MFTRSCSEVKVEAVATLPGDLDLSNITEQSIRQLRAPLGEEIMLGNIFRRRAPRLVAGNENGPTCAETSASTVEISKVRALATGAALATAVDSSPAVLVSIYDYAHRYRDRGRRTA